MTLRSFTPGRALAALSLLLAIGCGTTNDTAEAGSDGGQPLLGSTCTPESIPSGGFDSREVYLETSSASCESRACIVYQLDGDPRMRDCDEPGCVDGAEADMRSFCTCRCAGEPGSGPLCDCPTGFSCVADVVASGPASVAGGYCIREELAK